MPTEIITQSIFELRDTAHRAIDLLCCRYATHCKKTRSRNMGRAPFKKLIYEWLAWRCSVNEAKVHLSNVGDPEFAKDIIFLLSTTSPAELCLWRSRRGH